MKKRDFDTLTRRAAGRLSRSGSPLTIGRGARVAITARGVSTEAKKGRKKGPRCKRQVNQCRGAIAAACSPEDPDVCVALSACCSELGACDVTGFFACLVAIN
jgi:hypothetical protein